MNGNSYPFLESFRDHILRWNRQINLVSRQETEDRLDGLFGQCVEGHGVLEQWLLDNGMAREGGSIRYFDLGSGAGLPGVIWHRLWVHGESAPETCLVEPREKRAWLLERACGPEDGKGFSVSACRWGEMMISPKGTLGDDFFPDSLTVISLKALHLDNVEVLTGFSDYRQGQSEAGDLVIARYYPPDQILDPLLEGRLKLSPSGGLHQIRDYIYCGRENAVLPIAWNGVVVATLVLSAYQATNCL